MGGPPSLEQAIYSLPHEAPFNENADRVHAPAAPQREDADHGRAGTRARLQRRRDVNLAGGHGAEHAARRILPGAGRIRRRTRWSRSASKTSRRRSKSATRCSPGSRPSRSNCNYWTLAFRNIASLESENVGVGTLARAGIRARADRSEQRGLSRPRRPPTARRPNTPQPAEARSSTTTTCTTTPTRTSTGPGQPNVCEAGNENYVTGKAVDRQPARRATSPRTAKSPTANRTCSAKSTPPRRSRPSARQARVDEEVEGEEQMRRLRWWRRRDEVPVVELQRAAPCAAADRAARGDRDRRVLRLHQAHPVQTRLPSEGAVRHRGQHPARSRRCASPASTSAR